MSDPEAEARQWRARAEEYRRVAQSCRSRMARNMYERLALHYDALADRAEAIARMRGEAKPPATRPN